MQIVVVLVQCLTIAAFASYGATALLSERMVAEFERYGFARLRVPTAMLQIAGSLGLLAGFFYRPLLLLSAGGFAVMMLFAVLVRIKIRDPVHEIVPAFVLLCLDILLVVLG